MRTHGEVDRGSKVRIGRQFMIQEKEEKSRKRLEGSRVLDVHAVIRKQGMTECGESQFL